MGGTAHYSLNFSFSSPSFLCFDLNIICLQIYFLKAFVFFVSQFQLLFDEDIIEKFGFIPLQGSNQRECQKSLDINRLYPHIQEIVPG